MSQQRHWYATVCVVIDGKSEMFKFSVWFPESHKEFFI
jgi:hypothetical protein